jgi:6-phosphogluconolactonase
MTGYQAPGAHAHAIVTSHDDRFALVPCLGSNDVAQYAFDATTGRLVPNTPSTAPAPASMAGPRHIAFHPDGVHAYVINETDSTVAAYAFDANHGVLSLRQVVSTLPSGFSGTNTAAEVAIAPSGRYLYGSNRGDDSIAIYAIAPDGILHSAGWHPTGGRIPRQFSLDPTGTFLLVANVDSHNVVVFRLNAETGALGDPPASATQLRTDQAPYWVGVVELAGR